MIRPAVIIILVMCIINAFAVYVVYDLSVNVAEQAETSAKTALKLARSNERESVLRIDQSCHIAERLELTPETQGLEVAPAYCDEPNVGLPEKD